MPFVGRLHPVLVHFPIALVLAAAAAELAAGRRGRAAWRQVAVFNLRAGAVMGALTAWAGWALAAAPFVAAGSLLSWHKWLGGTGAAVAVAAALLSLRPPAGRAYRVALFAAAVILAVAGHLGGTLVWGDALTR